MNGSTVPSPSSHLLLLPPPPPQHSPASLPLTDTPPLSMPRSSSTISFDQRNYTLQSPLLPLSGCKKRRKETETESQGEASCQLKAFLLSDRVKRKRNCMRVSSHFKKFFWFEPFHLSKLSLHPSAFKTKTKEDASEKKEKEAWRCEDSALEKRVKRTLWICSPASYPSVWSKNTASHTPRARKRIIVNHWANS